MTGAPMLGHAVSRFLTTDELADYLRYRGPHAQNSAQKFVKRSGLRRYWRGRCVLVLRADVDAVLEVRYRASPVRLACTDPKGR